MQTMTATAGQVSADELGDVRRWAGEALEMAGPGDEYIAIRVAAVRATLDWVEGRVAVSPIGGIILEPTRVNLEGESLRAVDAETQLRRLRDRGTFPGVVRETLEWVLGRADPPV